MSAPWATQTSYPVQEWGEWPTCSPSGDLTLASVNEDPSFKRSPVFSVNGLIFLVICFLTVAIWAFSVQSLSGSWPAVPSLGFSLFFFFLSFFFFIFQWKEGQRVNISGREGSWPWKRDGLGFSLSLIYTVPIVSSNDGSNHSWHFLVPCAL